MNPDMPVVVRDDASAPFFDGAAAGVFLLRRCTNCGKWAPPTTRRCRRCQSTELEWRPSDGHATLVSWTVIHGRSDDASTEPTVVGLVQLSEGPWFTARLVRTDGVGLRAGTPLQVAFVHPEGGEPLPVFTPG